MKLYFSTFNGKFSPWISNKGFLLFILHFTVQVMYLTLPRSPPIYNLKPVSKGKKCKSDWESEIALHAALSQNLLTWYRSFKGFCCERGPCLLALSIVSALWRYLLCLMNSGLNYTFSAIRTITTTLLLPRIPLPTLCC